MVYSTTRVSLRLVFGLLLLLAAFYVGRPLYWKLSATIHEIRENRTTVKEGISQFVLEAQKSVGWVHDESDAGIDDQSSGKLVGVATNRRILRGNR
ncbi:low-density receptor-like protein [Tasmannia lanceolata]|uniref:low-density receptor-like protein n=1 Tax=Tasmannia lanceolata TaxID=3420 RepID=UPI0040635CC8